MGVESLSFIVGQKVDAPADSTDAGSSVTSEDEGEVENANMTSVILKNIPGNCDRESLLRILDQEGFTDSLNFVYLPMAFDKKQAASFRYTFMNFESPAR